MLTDINSTKSSAPLSARHTGRGRERHLYGSAVLAIVCLVVAFRYEVFFSGMGLAGLTYLGAESSPVFMTFVVLSSVAILIGAAYVLISSFSIRIRHVVIVCFPIILASVFAFDELTGRTQLQSQGQLMLALAFACPAAIAGMICADPRILPKLSFALEPMTWLFASAVIFSGAAVVRGDSEFGGIGGATYQTASYLGGIAFNCIIFYSLFGHVAPRLRLFRSRAYFFFCLAFLPVLCVATILTGGRGGVAMMVIGAVLQTIIACRRLRPQMIRRLVLLLAGLAPVVMWGIPWLLADAARVKLAERVFDYLGPTGVNWGGTSGRDMVYTQAISMIEGAPSFGYGLFNWGMDTLPHNMFVEFALNGGAAYVLVWCIFLCVLTARTIRIASTNTNLAPILPVALFPIVMLQFSGSYWANSSFWFVIALATCLQKDNSVASVAHSGKQVKMHGAELVNKGTDHRLAKGTLTPMGWRSA